MQATDGKRFRDLLRGMGRMFGQEPDRFVLDAYWIALREWDYADFEAAAAHLMSHSKFMPRPGDFNALRKASQVSPTEAWLSVLDYVKAGHHRNRLDVSEVSKPQLEPITLRALSVLGGFHAIAMSDEDKLHFLERRFCEHFERLQSAGDVREALPHLAASERQRVSMRSSGFMPIGAPPVSPKELEGLEP